jgi:predicted chitinase
MSDAMKALQAKVGAKPDGSFGPNTARAIAKHYQLSPARAAHLLGQASHESAGFRLVRENLNYTSETMMRVWPSRFRTLEEAQPFARNPKGLADKVYSNRMGNGDGEGHIYIGRGFLQLTGKDNYKAFAAQTCASLRLCKTHRWSRLSMPSRLRFGSLRRTICLRLRMRVSAMTRSSGSASA